VYPGYNSDLPTQLWIAARWLQALSFFAATFFLDRKLNRPLVVLAGGAVLSALLLLSIFYWNIFPSCFVEGTGLTPFKIASEYGISLILLISIVPLMKKKDKLHPRVRQLIIASILSTVASEMSFTLYTDAYGFFNALGHFFKVIAFIFIYKAVVSIGLKQPYDLLFRDLKIRQDELRRSEERYHSLFKHMLNGMAYCKMEFDADGRPVDFIYLAVNDAFEKLTGLKNVEGKRITEIMPSIRQDNPEFLELYGRVATTGQPEKRELLLKPLDLWLYISVYSVEKENFVAVFENITERRKAEKDYQSIFENVQEGIFRSTPEGKIILANEAMAKMFGYDSPAEIMADITDAALQLYAYPEDRAKMKAIMEEQNVVRNYEIQFHRKDGSAFWASATMKAIRNGKDRILYFEGILEDITERKQNIARLRKTLGGAVQAIASLVETRDPYTAGHQRRVADLARAIATEMGLSGDQIDGIRIAGTIHDLGKISVPSEILTIPRKLTALEYSLIKNHPQSGYDILKDIEFPWPIARMIVEHHERINGSGYPNGLPGEDLLIESKILSVADVVEAMATHRPYRPALGIDAALAEITANRGILYDPEVVDACLRLFRDKGYQISH
jgi:PAS domain S-box-containing protein